MLGARLSAISKAISVLTTVSGEVVFTNVGSGSWTVPAGVTSISFVCIGPGGSDNTRDNFRARTVASQMINAELLRTKIVTGIVGTTEENAKSATGVPYFTANGSRVVEQGWLQADPDAEGDERTLPAATKGDKLSLISVESTEKFTEPPSRYTEAGLVKELEKRGIGRPSTYASIIKTLADREYTTKKDKSLQPTDTGDVVSSFLEHNFATYISDSFTATMEDKLDEIAEGKSEYETTLREFYGPFHKEVKSKEKLDKATNLGLADSRFKCPTCGSGMIIKLGRGGKFLSCDRYPDCEGALTMEGKEIKKDEPIGMHPTENLPIFVLIGRYGPYVQLGGKSKELKKPRTANIPPGVDVEKITVADAVKFLSLPRALGEFPATGKMITANNGRFGPYIVHEKDFRSLKEDDVYTITLERAIEILKTPKVFRGRGRPAAKKKEESKKE
jgi:DNA topoisomerase-1